MNLIHMARERLKNKRVPHYVWMTLRYIRLYGARFTAQKYIDKVKTHRAVRKMLKAPLFSDEELEQQRQTTFPKSIKFSIVVPLYNTPEKLLREMIQSVVDQTYPNWEICLADGSDGKHGAVGRICADWARRDDRIKYKKLEKNLGISGNTNACLEMATGDYISLFDHDDLLHPAALHEVMRAICQQNADFIYTDEAVFHNQPKDAFCMHFKPDYAPDTLRANNYICHFTTFKASLLEKVGNFHSECDGSQDFDMVLRLTEQTEHIVHIPEILYYWRAHKGSVASDISEKPYVIEAAHRAVAAHLRRVGLEGEVMNSEVPSIYRIKYKLQGRPLVSVLIPSHEHAENLKRCIDSIYEKTSYDHFEIIIIENNSRSQAIFDYYRAIQQEHENIRVVEWKGIGFNVPEINNFGATFAKGEYLLLLSNDTEVITSDWMQEMLMFAQRKDVGAVGAKLFYPNEKIQHGGIGLGIGGAAGELHKGCIRQSYGYMGRLCYAQNLSAVTAACMMIRRDIWNEMGGLDGNFAVTLNDVDLCMRIRKAGYLIVWTPFAELYRYESRRRGGEDTPENEQRFNREVGRFQERWKRELAMGDPYLNPNFSPDRCDFLVDISANARERVKARERIRIEDGKRST